MDALGYYNYWIAIAIIMMTVMAPLVTAFWVYARRLQHVESAA